MGASGGRAGGGGDRLDRKLGEEEQDMTQDGEILLRKAYLYLGDMEQQARDTSNSPFCLDIKDECKWYADYYESGKDFIEDFWRDNQGIGDASD